MISSPLMTRWSNLSVHRMYALKTVFSFVSNVSAFVEIALSPIRIFSIAIRPDAVITNLESDVSEILKISRQRWEIYLPLPGKEDREIIYADHHQRNKENIVHIVTKEKWLQSL